MSKSKYLTALISKAPLHKIPLELIELDKENPRIQFLIDSEYARGVKDDEITQAKLKLGQRVKTKTNYDSLKESIETAGLLEPIWVFEKNGKYVVIEGNTRKLIFDELYDKYPHDTEWQTIEARILPPDTSEEVIAFLRLEFHLGGKQPWDPYERARYLYTLNQKGYPTARLARETRSKETEIKNDLAAFKIMHDHFLAKYGDNLDNPVSKYSYFVELVGKKKVRNLEITRVFSIDDFCRWVAEERIPRAIDVRDLPEIFSNEEVAKVFKDKGYETAMDLLATIKPDVASPLFRDVEKVIDQLQNLRQYEINLIREEEPAKKDLLKKLIVVTKSVVE
ncbi:ParB N-terminal domain-containing protein [Candidatus Daviesbacteria bacterium]|nr:ParB N-terminal domain-containing protein [Candidatus Daviesbacteria bacterium]